MVLHDIESVRAYVREKVGALPRIEERLDSTNTKIQYLVKKVNRLSKAQTGADVNALTQERLMLLAEKLRRLGLTIEYTDGFGYIKLKALDTRGLDNLKRLNDVFPISMIESFIENCSL